MTMHLLNGGNLRDTKIDRTNNIQTHITNENSCIFIQRSSRMWLETDLEPDDVLAIYTLPKNTIRYVVVGEGNSSIKLARMQRYVQLLNQTDTSCFDTNVMLIQGLDSDKPYHNDGKEFSELSIQQSSTDTNRYLREFINFVAQKR